MSGCFVGGGGDGGGEGKNGAEEETSTETEVVCQYVSNWSKISSVRYLLFRFLFLVCFC